MDDSRADKAILIDAENRTISEVVITDYSDISKFGRFQHFDAVQLDRKGNTVYIDDEGLINGTEYGFLIANYPDPLMGNGVILGTNLRTGESQDTDLSVEQVRSMVRFLAPSASTFFADEGDDFDPSLNEENEDLIPDPLDHFETGSIHALERAAAERKAERGAMSDRAYDRAMRQAVTGLNSHPNIDVTSILEKAAIDNGIRGEENVRRFVKWAGRQISGITDVDLYDE